MANLLWDYMDEEKTEDRGLRVGQGDCLLSTAGRVVMADVAKIPKVPGRTW